MICRYKIKLEISDSTATATCVLFEKEAQKLISESVSFMVESINHDTKEVPKPVQKICGHTLSFQFRLTDYNIKSCKPDYTVSRLFIPVGKNSSTIKIKKDEEVFFSYQFTCLIGYLTTNFCYILLDQNEKLSH